jgi:hypothetical protein
VKESFYEKLDRISDKLPKYEMKILLGEFNAKVGKEDILKPIIVYERLHEISNYNGIRVVNFVILPAALSPGIYSVANRNEY